MGNRNVSALDALYKLTRDVLIPAYASHLPKFPLGAIKAESLDPAAPNCDPNMLNRYSAYIPGFLTGKPKCSYKCNFAKLVLPGELEIHRHFRVPYEKPA